MASCSRASNRKMEEMSETCIWHLWGKWIYSWSDTFRHISDPVKSAFLTALLKTTGKDFADGRRKVKITTRTLHPCVRSLSSVLETLYQVWSPASGLSCSWSTFWWVHGSPMGVTCTDPEMLLWEVKGDTGTAQLSKVCLSCGDSLSFRKIQWGFQFPIRNPKQMPKAPEDWHFFPEIQVLQHSTGLLKQSEETLTSDPSCTSDPISMYQNDLS